MKRAHFRINFQKLKKKFQLTIFNESTLENFFSLRVSLMDGIFLGLSLIILSFFASYLLLVHTPMRSFLPQDLDPKLRKEMLTEATRVDSLSAALEKQSRYLKVVKGILSGNIPVDSLRKNGRDIPLDTLANRHLTLITTTRREEKFREEFEEGEKYNLSVLRPQPATPEGLLFYPPLKGKIVSKFSSKGKTYGIRIEINDQQPSLAVLDGTILFAGYTSDFDFVIEIQHNNDYVSVYKYNTELLKKQGDKVKAGEAIGIAGDNPARAGLPYLYFELWHKGVALNPEEYIVF
jgi:murein DD-endopeptidase MepM/ murein hydrolase activator NlpD